MFKMICITVALGAAAIAAPAVSDSPDWNAKHSPHQQKESSGTLPATVLISGVALVAIANRRRNLQRVLC